MHEPNGKVRNEGRYEGDPVPSTKMPKSIRFEGGFHVCSLRPGDVFTTSYIFCYRYSDMGGEVYTNRMETSDMGGGTSNHAPPCLRFSQYVPSCPVAQCMRRTRQDGNIRNEGRLCTNRMEKSEMRGATKGTRSPVWA